MHRFASLVSVVAFLLMLVASLVSGAGGRVTLLPMGGLGSRAGLGMKYAHAYQLIAASVIIMTLILAVWLWRSAAERYLKKLAAWTLAVLLLLAAGTWFPVFAQMPEAGPFAFTLGIEIFFCLTVCLALFTRGDWRWDHPKSRDLAAPSVRQVLVFMTAALLLEGLLGQGFQQQHLGIAPHFILGGFITVCAVWVMEMALSKYPHLRAFKMASVMLAELVLLELFLGIITFSMGLNARAVAGPQPGVLVMNVTHAAVGGLVLATSLFVTCQAFKYFEPATK